MSISKELQLHPQVEGTPLIIEKRKSIHTEVAEEIVTTPAVKAVRKATDAPHIKAVHTKAHVQNQEKMRASMKNVNTLKIQKIF